MSRYADIEIIVQRAREIADRLAMDLEDEAISTDAFGVTDLLSVAIDELGELCTSAQRLDC